jgi:anhydro-N-acetylmuramic acid kinase
VLAVGLMSGTSLDGIDAALVEILPRGNGYAVTLRRFELFPFEETLRTELLAVLPPNAGTLAAAARLHYRLGSAYARAAQAVAAGHTIGYVASHGQTIWHDGRARVTLQLGDPFTIRDALDASVCYDFRSADCAAGGHGAPLMPFVDALLLSTPAENRVAINLGGIANVTLVRAGSEPAEAIGFDAGPANMLIDALVWERTGGTQRFDDGGRLASAGRVDGVLLRAMLGDEYFALPPPKSTGRERFGAHFLAAHAAAIERLSLEDAAATLTELTALSIAKAIEGAGFRGARAIVSGGGARNATLLARLRSALAPAEVESSERFGLPPDSKEAMAFAVLGYETLRGRAANAIGATGAHRHVTLGAIAPSGLRELLAQVDAECKDAA